MTHQGDDAIGRAAIHEVVVDGLTSLRGERHAVGIVVKLSGGVVIPVESPTLDALDHILEVLEVRLFHAFVLAAAVHLTVLDGAQSVDGLALVEGERLVQGLKAVLFLAQQHLALGGHKGDATGLGVEFHAQFTTRCDVAPLGEGYLLRLGDDHLALGCYGLARVLDDMHHRRGEEFNLHALCPQGDGCQQGQTSDNLSVHSYFIDVCCSRRHRYPHSHRSSWWHS